MQPGATSQLSSRSVWLWPAAVFLAACLPFAGTLSHPFVHDDLTVIGANPIVQERGRALEAFRTDYWAMRKDDPKRDRLYRPLTTLTLALNHAWGGSAPGGYRLLNILLHALASLLLLWAARRSGLGAAPAGATALLFALHPLHTEAVNAVVARADLMAAVGVFAGMALLLGRALPLAPAGEGGERAASEKKAAPGPSPGAGPMAAAGAALAFLFALFSKEAGAALLLWAGAWWLWGRLAGWKRGPGAPPAAAWAGMGAALLIYLYLRYAALGLWVRPVPPSRLDNPLAHAGLLERIWGALGVLGRGFKLTVWPWPLSLDYSYAQVLPGGMETALYAAAGLAALLGWGWLAWRWRGEAPWAGQGFALFLAGWLPAANLLVPIGTVMAERAMYLPSAGLLLAAVPSAALWLSRLGRGDWRAPAGALAAVALFFGGLTWARNGEWADPLRLWERAAQVSPRSARALRSHGHYLIRKGRFAEAVPLLRAAVRIYPLYDPAWIDLGIAQMQTRHEKEAEGSLREALRLNAGAPEAHLALGALYLGTGRLEEAQRRLERAVALAPHFAESRFNLGTLYLKLGQRKLAIDHLRAALALDPVRGDAHHNLAIALYLEGDEAGARRHAQEAARRGVRLHPAMAKALGLTPSP